MSNISVVWRNPAYIKHRLSIYSKIAPFNIYKCNEFDLKNLISYIKLRIKNNLDYREIDFAYYFSF